MHDPLVVAFEIRRPWPRRAKTHDSKFGQPRWKIRFHHDCSKYDCVKEHEGQKFFPWWKPSSYCSFWTLAGRGFYWPSMITIWHREPNNYDAGEICKHYTRTDQPDGSIKIRTRRNWKWHVHHWHIQISPLQELRRKLLTRCTWCGGPSRKGNVVNVSHQWDKKRQPWWKGEQGLFHRDCSMYQNARHQCLCDEPLTLTGYTYGKCALCEKYISGRRTASHLKRLRLLASVAQGKRDAEVIRQVEEEAKAYDATQREVDE